MQYSSLKKASVPKSRALRDAEQSSISSARSWRGRTGPTSRPRTNIPDRDGNDSSRPAPPRPAAPHVPAPGRIWAVRSMTFRLERNPRARAAAGHGHGQAGDLRAPVVSARRATRMDRGLLCGRVPQEFTGPWARDGRTPARGPAVDQWRRRGWREVLRVPAAALRRDVSTLRRRCRASQVVTVLLAAA